jgi:hypothetical protein
MVPGGASSLRRAGCWRACRLATRGQTDMRGLVTASGSPNVLPEGGSPSTRGPRPRWPSTDGRGQSCSSTPSRSAEVWDTGNRRGRDRPPICRVPHGRRRRGRAECQREPGGRSDRQPPGDTKPAGPPADRAGSGRRRSRLAVTPAPPLRRAATETTLPRTHPDRVTVGGVQHLSRRSNLAECSTAVAPPVPADRAFVGA